MLTFIQTWCFLIFNVVFCDQGWLCHHQPPHIFAEIMHLICRFLVVPKKGENHFIPKETQQGWSLNSDLFSPGWDGSKGECSQQNRDIRMHQRKYKVMPTGVGLSSCGTQSQPVAAGLRNPIRGTSQPPGSSWILILDIQNLPRTVAQILLSLELWVTSRERERELHLDTPEGEITWFF